jgi:hypothetical protein
MKDVPYEIFSPQVIQETIEGEVIIVSLESGNYYSLRDTGGEIWQLAVSSYSQSEIIEAIKGQYQVDGLNLGDIVIGFLDQLVEHQLLKPSQTGKALQVTIEPKQKDKKTFAEPKLEIYSDMQELFLLDPIHEVDDSGWPTRKE